MNYKLIYCVLNYEEYGDCWSIMFSPMAFDDRHLKTRERVLMTLKEEMMEKIYHFYKERDINIDLDITHYHDIDTERNIYMYDKHISFNENHNTRILSTINKNSEEREIYIWGYIIETSPDMIKESVSDLEQFANKEKEREAILNSFPLETITNFKMKDILYCSRYNIDASYDTADGIEYHGGFKSISKNLMALLLSEDEEFAHEAESFYKYCYPDQDEYNIHNDTNFQTLIRKTLSDIALNKLTKDDILRGNFLLCNCTNCDGFRASCSIIRVPIVSYIGR